MYKDKSMGYETITTNHLSWKVDVDIETDLARPKMLNPKTSHGQKPEAMQFPPKPLPRLRKWPLCISLELESEHELHPRKMIEEQHWIPSGSPHSSIQLEP